MASARTLSSLLCLLLAAIATAAPKTPPPSPSPQLHVPPGFCGVEVAAEEEVIDPPLPCGKLELPRLPCGPAASTQVGPSGAELSDDLDGDGAPDAVLAGRKEHGKDLFAYGIIYLQRPSRAGGPPEPLVMADFQRLPLHAEPSLASVALVLPRGTPLVRDGYDLPLLDGRTLSVARLRRFDGERFRTLLTFCAHRLDREGDKPREAHNRIAFSDVDRDGTPEVVISGAVRPTVYRLEGATRLREDAALTQRYRDDSPEEKKAKVLQTEANRLLSQGERRRAAAALKGALILAPHNGDLALQLIRVLLRSDDPEEALRAARVAVRLLPERAEAYCLLAEALRAADDDEEEGALQACLARSPAPPLRASAAQRLHALRAAAASPLPDGGSPHD